MQFLADGTRGDSYSEFPDYNVKESEKNKKEYHKKWVKAITRRSLTNSFDLYYTALDESYQFFDGTNTGDEFGFLQETEDGDVLPAQWINYNKIRTKVKLLMGELSSKGYRIDVRTINNDAVVRKATIKRDKYVDFRMNQLAGGLQQKLDFDFGYKPEMPQNIDEFQQSMKNFKDDAEFIMEEILKALARRMKWGYTRMALFRDLVITNRCFAKVEIVNGIPEVRRIDPRRFTFDQNATDDYLSDSSYFGEVRYMSVGDAAQMYNLTQDQIKAAYKDYESLLRDKRAKKQVAWLEGSNMSFYRNDDGNLRVLVFTATWQDYKRLRNRYSVDSYGSVHVKSVSPDKKAKEDEKDTTIKIWRKATLIGHDIVVDWGEIKNQVRNVDDIYDSESPYFAYIPDYVNNIGVSIVEQLKGLQKLKDITMYNLQLEMARAKGKGIVYDISQIPEDWDIDEVLKYLKTAGVMFIDSKRDGIPSQFNQFQEVNLTLDSSIRHYIEISMMVDREMDAITGINDARQGMSSTQAVGVTQSALIQSNVITAPLFNGFHMFSGNVFSSVANMAKFSFRDKEKLAPVLGISNLELFADSMPDFDLDQFHAYIEENPRILDDIQLLQQIVMAALSTQSIKFSDAMMLLMEKDVEVAYRKLRKLEEEMEQKAQAAAIEQQQAAEAAKEQQQQALLTHQRTLMREGNRGKERLQNNKDAAAMRRELAKGKINLLGKRMDVNKQKNQPPKKK